MRRAALPVGLALLMVALLAAPGGANDGLPDLPTPPGAPSATLVHFEIVNPELGGPAICAAYLAERGDGAVHVWQFCNYPSSTAGTLHFFADPSDPAESQCNTHRRGFFGSEIQVVDLAVDVIELDGDQGDLGDFLPEGEFTQEVCFYEWTWTEETAEPLRRFW